jgi:hypothetical protein
MMPSQLTTPDRKLTYGIFGKVVNYTLDDRESRIETALNRRYVFSYKTFYKDLLDLMILISQYLVVLSGFKFIVE